MRPLPAFGLVAVLATGCGGADTPAPPALPRYDAEAVTQAALKQLDKNGNSVLDAAELDGSAGLKGALAEIDANGDRQLTADELRNRFSRYSNVGSGYVSVTCVVTLDDNPLPGAVVRFEPEGFMGAALKPAEATASEEGRAPMKTEGTDAYGVMPGVYRITVTHPSRPIPARYNTKTIFGREVFEGGRSSPGSIDLRLKSG